MKTPSFDYIDSSIQSDQLVATLEHVQEVALDIEGSSLHSYQDQVCLIQLSFNERCILIDPLSPIDLQPILLQLQNKNLIFNRPCPEQC